jgi:peptidyl-prolyl cis-trans isomerase SurA
MKRFCGVLLMAALVVGSVEADILERILVKVNGDIITKTALEKRQVAFLRQGNLGDLANDDAELARVLREATPDLIVNAIDEMLLAQRGRELGYSLSDERFDEIVANLKEQNEIESDEQFQAALERESMTMSDLRDAMERQMLVSRVQQVEVFGNFSVTDEEEREYYASHPEEFSSPPMVTLREILVEVPDLRPAGSTQPMINVAQEEASRAKVDAILARLAAGEDFGQVAGEVSDAASQANGGLIGPLKRDELASTFLDAISTLQVGEVSEPLRTTAGYHLIKLESSTDAIPAPFDEVKGSIAQKMFNERRVAEVDKYLRELRDQAIIEWKDDNLKAAYEEGLRKADEAFLQQRSPTS